MPSDAKVVLGDIAENILLAKRWTDGLSVDAFSEDRKTFYAVTRCLEIISEASRRLPDGLKQRGVNVPWSDIRDAGNVYRHQYDQVQERRVYTTVTRYLGELETFVLQELGRP